MALAAPILGGVPSKDPDKEIIVKLSDLNGPLTISIPDSSELFPEGTVYAILGKDEENPDWSGGKTQAGNWNNETEEVERLLNLKVYVPKEILETYLNKTVELRLQTIGESSLAMSSPPVVLRIEE